jgi:hypothetical protein
MPTMVPLLRSAVLTALLSVSLAAQLPRRPNDLPADARQILTQRLGGEPFAALAAWHRLPRGDKPPAWLPERGQWDRPWTLFLHAALWHEDPAVAYAAACLLPREQLDLPAADRWLAVVWPHLWDEEAAYDWDQFRRMASSADVARVLAVQDCWRAEIRFGFQTDMHRCLRPEHVPALCELTQRDDPVLRRHAWSNLATVATYSDQHRERIARALLAWPGPDGDVLEFQDERAKQLPFAPRPVQLPTARPGWSPLLRAALERAFLDLPMPAGQTRVGAVFGPFLARWAEDERPAAEDRLLLNALLDCGRRDGVCLALRTLARMPANAFLQQRLETVGEVAPAALACAARHDGPALRALAATDSEALAVALEFDFDATFLQWAAVAFGADAKAGLAALERLAEAADALALPLRPAPQLPARLRLAIDAFGAQLDHDRLHRLVVDFPMARSPRLLELYWQSVTPQNLADCAFPVLEVSVGWHERLREWAAAEAPAVHGPAREWLLRVGDTQLADALLAHWQQHHADDLALLLRIGAAKPIAAWLAAHLAEQWPAGTSAAGQAAFAALAAVAALQGVPHEVAQRWAEELQAQRGEPRVRDRLAAWRDAVAEGAAIDALVEFYGGGDLAKVRVWGLGQIDDDRVRELLGRVRDTPGADQLSVVGERMLAGDYQARIVVDTLRTRHVYGWFDDACTPVQTGGRSLDLVPWLLAELETNCCRRNSAASALQELTGFDVWEQPEHGLVTQPARARAWWAAVGEHLRWSEAARRFEVAAH